MTAQVNERIAGIYADGWSRIVATMIRLTGGDWDLAEECAQDAFTQALRKWPESGQLRNAWANASCAHSSARSHFPPVNRIMAATIRLHPSA